MLVWVTCCQSGSPVPAGATKVGRHCRQGGHCTHGKGLCHCLIRLGQVQTTLRLLLSLALLLTLTHSPKIKMCKVHTQKVTELPDSK